MATLPYSRVVNVTLTRNSAFPDKRGFGVALFLTSDSAVGELDASNLTKVYATIEEVKADFATTTDFYKAANAAFSQNPKPIQIKAGWYNSATVDDAPKMKTALDALYEADNQWYWLCVETSLRDTVMLNGVIEWIETKNKIAVLDSNDANTKTASDTTCVAARHKNTVERTAVFYHDTAAEHCAFALAASLGTRNFDNADGHYTAKFKNIKGVSAINAGSAAVQAITGFTPALGQSTAAGHMANTYINIGGKNFVTEGSTLTPNVFIDEIHSSDWIVARTEEEILGILLNNDAIPYTDQGMDMLASSIRTVMQLAVRTGIVAKDINETTGLYEAAYTITVPSVFDVAESQRKTRVAPAITVRFRYAGAVHYTTVNYNMTF